MPFLRNLGYGVSTGAGAALRELERQWKNADAATAASTLQDREDARQGVHLRSLASMKAAEHGLAHPEQTEAINAAYGPQGASPLRLPADAELLRPLIHSINAAKSRNELPANVGTAMAAQGVKSALANTSPEDVVLPEANESGNSVDTPLPTPEGYEPPYANQSRKLDEMGLGRDETGTYSTPPAGTVTRETRDFAPQSQQTIESLMKEKESKLPSVEKGFTLGADQTRYDENGNEIASGKDKGPKTPTEGMLDAAFQLASAKKKRGLPLTPEEEDTLVGFHARKAETPDINYNLHVADKASARLDRSYAQNQNQLNVIRKPLLDQQERLARLGTSIDQMTPQADALIAPELLTAMAGGAGSGLRMNEAEISRIVGGRSGWENLKARLLHWQEDPSKALSITPAQRVQMHQLMRVVKDRNLARQKMINDAESQLIDADTVGEHRGIINQLHIDLSNDETEAPASTAPKRIHYDLNGNVLPEK